jgi:ribonucleoside-diphosphate reductase alpha subunit
VAFDFHLFPFLKIILHTTRTKMDDPNRMYVIKRDGQKEELDLTKIQRRIRNLADDLHVNADLVSQKTVSGLVNNITTSEIDEHAASTAAYMGSKHPDYSLLAGRIVASNLTKLCDKRFSECVERMYHAKHPTRAELDTPLLNEKFYNIVQMYKKELDDAIVPERDLTYDYFAFKTLERAYLHKIKGKTVETIQYMLMRVAIGIHGDNLKAILKTYELSSQKYFTHATPTLFNAGTMRPQMSSCFLLTMKDDSIDGIYDTLKQCAKVSKYAGGIGLSVSNIRATGSYISGTNGTSNGLLPMLRVFDATARYVDQGGGKRKGSIAIYLEPWHADVYGFLELKKNSGKDAERARDLFYALWVPDLFMERALANEEWTLFCPNEAPGLFDVYGKEFVALYERYEREGRGRKKVSARELFNHICAAETESGNPNYLYKDACNRKSNHKHLGTIRSSNLCCEVVQFSSPQEVAVCNLASINLSKFVVQNVDGTMSYDFVSLKNIAGLLTENLNMVIDGSFYPLEEAKLSNRRHRPIGIGVQGLANTFMMMHYPYESAKAKQLNRDIFETIYYGACEASMEMARLHGAYQTYEGSPMSKGLFQFDMWGDENEPYAERSPQPNPALGWNWTGLRASIKKYGMRNSLLTAVMPTASTSQILGQYESTEPMDSNLFVRRTLAGDYFVANKYLVKDLTDLGLWSESMCNLLKAHRGSIQDIDDIPKDLKDIYKTTWEIKQMNIIAMAAARGPFIDQSQSMNIRLANPTIGSMTTVHFQGWQAGLKTGLYYLHTRPKSDPIAFTVDPVLLKQLQEQKLKQQPEQQQTKSAVVSKPQKSQLKPLPEETMEAESEAPAQVGRFYEGEDGCMSCGS